MELTKQDIELLIEGVRLWENKPIDAGMVTSLIGSMLCKESDKIEANVEKTMKAAEKERGFRKERSIVVQAKLIAMKDSIDADNLLKESTKG